MEQRKQKRKLEQMKAQARGCKKGRGKRLLNPGSFATDAEQQQLRR
jgi:hypothetical protein